MNKKILLILGLCLIFPATIMAAENTAVWGWYRGADDCALWSMGCTSDGYALIPLAPDWNVITTTDGCPDMMATAKVETKSGMAYRVQINYITPPLYDAPSGSHVSVQSSVLPITDGVASVEVVCQTIPSIADLKPFEYGRSPLAHFKTLTPQDVFDMGRYALTMWDFIRHAPFIRSLILAFLLLPLAMTVIYRRLRRPPEI